MNKKEIKEDENKKDKCVCCGVETEYYITDHIDKRYNYVECVGQLCEDCYTKTTNNKF